ncbi:50S ribosomal protein L2 [Vulcanisaeta thermophila]|uniref:50S ribosomal protein L2 n=1 Tax=Vulcanisaeta thermophila TaxID=867917 RepID=UPI000853ABAE|nr:50S ribosomal protein L2 [Vulcanisaeta thermophila]
MGKRILVQRRGRGGSQFRNPGWLREGPVRYMPISEAEVNGVIRGIVRELIHVPGLNAPVARIVLEDGREFLNYAAEGMSVGQVIEVGAMAKVSVGNVLPLAKVPDGTMVYNIEKRPGDGGKFARSGGTYAIVLSHKDSTTVVQLPSGKIMEIDSRSRATIGIVAGGGRIEKPFVKAGAKYYRARVKSWKYPTVRGKAMNAYAHPHGGGSHQKGETPVARNAPPGQKVGIIAPRCTGRRCPQIVPRASRVWASGYSKKTRLSKKRSGAIPPE